MYTLALTDVLGSNDITVSNSACAASKKVMDNNDNNNDNDNVMTMTMTMTTS